MDGASRVPAQVPAPWQEKGKEAIFRQIKQEAPTSKWGGLEVHWNELVRSKEIDHIYRFTVNRDTGDLYLDCNKQKLTLKFALYTVLQPIVLSAKTVYHLLLPISIPYEIFRECQKIKAEDARSQVKMKNPEKAKRVFKAVAWSVANIVVTPGCAAVSAIIGVAGVIIGPFAPKRFLYDLRATAGKVEMFLHGGDKKSKWIVFACFQPISHISKMEEWGLKHKDQSGQWVRGAHEDARLTHPHTLSDTKYADDISDEQRGLTNLARGLIEFRRTTRALFNSCMLLLPREKQYLSSYIETKNKTT